MIRLIAVDMDGTLLNENKQIPAENIQALKQAADQGVALAVCSGRTAEDISYFLSDAGIRRCAVISQNGTYCLKSPHGEPYSLHTFTRADAQRVSDIFMKHQITYADFHAQRVIVMENDLHMESWYWGTHVGRGNPEAFRRGPEALQQYRDEGTCKFVCVDRDGLGRIEKIRKELAEIEGVTVTSSWPNNLELVPTGVGKGTALAELAEKLNIPQEQVMAFGDFDNDLDMIEYAGLGVAMSNATDNVKKVAQYITLDNQANGVAAAIRKFVLHS
ncbi:MAG: Cof-type HAD-IIB family hydrolase [Eubacteriales bacterium]|nr:Cof-type HAD-IIB family hydrolase [Eubacteriales bacterium]